MYYLGIDLGGTNIAIGIVDENYKVLIKDSVPTGAEREGRAVIRDMADLCKKLLDAKGLTVDQIEYAGIATPGTANSEKGIVEYANNLNFVNFPIADILKEYLGVKTVYIENDANVAALAEAVAGAAKGAKDSVMITLGTGVGGGIIIDNKVYSGFNFAGAELGHMVIVHNGVPCNCGRRGCWESYSSAPALVRMTKEKILECREKGIETKLTEGIEDDLSNVSARTAFAVMKTTGDKAAKEVVDDYIAYLATGIGNIINIFQPEILSITGGISKEGDYLLKPLLEIINKERYTRGDTKQTEVKIASLGNDAGIIGAAALGRARQ
ncbi:MAG: ROK family protein [Clostridia bacterium]|nr:ROK family protein [Clostridia bacterium]